MEKLIDYHLIDPDVVNGFFVCASIALLCIGFSIVISSFKN